MTSGKYIKTEKHRKNLSLSLKGRKLSKEHKRKVSESLIGHKRNLGRKRKPFSEKTKKKISEIMIKKYKNKELIPRLLGKHCSEMQKQKMRNHAKNNPNFGMKGKHHSIESKQKMRIANLGKKQTEETKLKKYNSNLGKHNGERNGMFGKKGELNPSWKGGITPINMKIRTSLEYKLWRTAVFERDNYTCIWCGVRSGNGKATILHADHIKPFALFPELRFAIDNGRTLCVDCHKKTESYAGRIKRFKI